MMIFLCPKCRQGGSICYDKVPGRERIELEDGTLVKDTYRCILCGENWTLFHVIDHVEDDSGVKYTIKAVEK